MLDNMSDGTCSRFFIAFIRSKILSLPVSLINCICVLTCFKSFEEPNLYFNKFIPLQN